MAEDLSGKTYQFTGHCVTSRTDALTKSNSYSYDATGNLASHADRDGNVINYSYDALNRPTQAQYNIPKGHGTQLQSTVTYTWDAGNRVTQAVDSIAGTVTRQYNGLDRVTQEVTPQGTVNYTRDNIGRRSTMQVVGQSQVSYTFDNANRLTGISQGSQSVGLN